MSRNEALSLDCAQGSNQCSFSLSQEPRPSLPPKTLRAHEHPLFDGPAFSLRPANQVLSDSDDDEVSSIHFVSVNDFDVVCHVAIETPAMDRNHSEPTPIYARPYNMIDGKRCNFPNVYYLGTRFSTGVMESLVWREEMEKSGASQRAITQCEEYLRENHI